MGLTYLVRFPFPLFFPLSVLFFYHGENVISYFRHGLIHCFPNSLTMEILLSEKLDPRTNRINCVKN
jgi:hypothetical protein